MLDRLDLIDMLSRCEPQERREAEKQFDRADLKQADALAVLASEAVYQRLKFGKLD